MVAALAVTAAVLSSRVSEHPRIFAPAFFPAAAPCRRDGSYEERHPLLLVGGQH